MLQQCSVRNWPFPVGLGQLKTQSFMFTYIFLKTVVELIDGSHQKKIINKILGECMEERSMKNYRPHQLKKAFKISSSSHSKNHILGLSPI